MLFASWAYHSQAMQGGEQAFLQRMSALAEAASAAEKVLNLMASWLPVEVVVAVDQLVM